MRSPNPPNRLTRAVRRPWPPLRTYVVLHDPTFLTAAPAGAPVDARRPVPLGTVVAPSRPVARAAAIRRWGLAAVGAAMPSPRGVPTGVLAAALARDGRALLAGDDDPRARG